MHEARIRPCAALIAAVGLAMASVADAQQAMPDPVAQKRAPLPFDAVPIDAETPFGGIALSPTRIEMEGGSPTARVTIYNTGDTPFRLDVDAIDFAVDAHRNYVPVAEGEVPPWSLLPMLRYAPRRAVVQPGERQVVRLIARGFAADAAREWRSHLQLTVDRIADPAGPPVAQPQEPDAMRAVAKLNYAIQIPVILRAGAANSATRIADVAMGASAAAPIVVTLERDGPHGRFGTVQVQDAAGNAIVETRGVSVLVPSRTRIVSLPIPAGAPAPARVVFADDNGRGAIGTVISEYALD